MSSKTLGQTVRRSQQIDHVGGKPFRWERKNIMGYLSWNRSKICFRYVLLPESRFTLVTNRLRSKDAYVNWSDQQQFSGYMKWNNGAINQSIHVVKTNPHPAPWTLDATSKPIQHYFVLSIPFLFKHRCIKLSVEANWNCCIWIASSDLSRSSY